MPFATNVPPVSNCAGQASGTRPRRRTRCGRSDRTPVLACSLRLRRAMCLGIIWGAGRGTQRCEKPWQCLHTIPSKDTKKTQLFSCQLSKHFLSESNLGAQLCLLLRGAICFIIFFVDFPINCLQLPKKPSIFTLFLTNRGSNAIFFYLPFPAMRLQEYNAPGGAKSFRGRGYEHSASPASNTTG